EDALDGDLVAAGLRLLSYLRGKPTRYPQKLPRDRMDFALFLFDENPEASRGHFSPPSIVPRTPAASAFWKTKVTAASMLVSRVLITSPASGSGGVPIW